MTQFLKLYDVRNSQVLINISHISNVYQFNKEVKIYFTGSENDYINTDYNIEEIETAIKNAYLNQTIITELKNPSQK